MKFHVEPGTETVRAIRSDRYLGHVDELGENLSSQLGGRPAQHHQLNPLGNTVAQGYRALHHGDVLHAAAADVVLVVYKLTGRAERRA